jgi:purine-binding chemotaxis protein CheW
MAIDDRLMYDDEFEEDEDTMEDMYLTFGVHNRDYGVSIRNVIEIVVLQTITEVPDLPKFVKGIINLRGKVIPLIDVRQRFQMATAEYNDRTCVIIIEINQLLIGLIVDSVKEVLKIPKEQMEPAPRVGGSYSSRFVDKVGKVGEEIKIILNLNTMLNEVEVKQMGDFKDEANQDSKKEETAVK